MSTPNRGFAGRHRPGRDVRLPPGQYDVGSDWPVLTAEVTPHLDPQKWTMRVDGLVAREQTWTWDAIHALPASEYGGDIHCVTTWSKLATSFGGVSVDVLLDAAEPDPTATHVLVTSTTGYTTNMPLADVRNGQAWVVWTHEGRPLPREHGGPGRGRTRCPRADRRLVRVARRRARGRVRRWERGGAAGRDAPARRRSRPGRPAAARRLGPDDRRDAVRDQADRGRRAARGHPRAVAVGAAGAPAHDSRAGTAVQPRATYFVCGSAGFAEATSTGLTDLGVPAAMTRVERFGPTA